MCIRCQDVDAPQPLGLCPACAVQVRLEFSAGLRRMGDYLAKWAAFEDWLSERPPKPA